MLFGYSFFLDLPKKPLCYVLFYWIIFCLRRLPLDHSYWVIIAVVMNHQDRKQEGIFESSSHQDCLDVYRLTPVFSSYPEQILILHFFYSWRRSQEFYHWIRSLDPFESVKLQQIYSISNHALDFFGNFLIRLIWSPVLNWFSILMLISPDLWRYQHSRSWL